MGRNTRIATWIVLASIATFPVITYVQAQTPPPPVAERQESMKARAAAARPLAQMVRGDVPWNAEIAQQQAARINAEAKRTPELFPEGTGPDRVPQTNALPAVWQNKAEFEAQARALDEATARLVQLAQANDEAGFRTQFQAVGRACGSCHEKFRKPQ